MFKHILIATDGSELSSKAVEHGIALGKHLGATITAITVTEPWTTSGSSELGNITPPGSYREACAANAVAILGPVAEIARKVGVTCETLHVTERHPAEGIVETAVARGCDLIVMATHGRRGITRLMLGSQANKVMTLSPVPVLIWR